MKITLEAKPYEILVEVPGYGIFKVHRIGAGTEATLAAESLEINDLNNRLKEEYADISAREVELTKAGDETGLETLRATDEYKSAKSLQDKITAKLQTFSSKMAQVELDLWSSDDQEALKRFKSELTMAQIRNLYQQAIKQADGESE